MKFEVFIFSLFWCLYSAKAARILALLTVEARSHFHFHEAMFKSLASAGHEVTLINQYVTNAEVKNYTLIQIPAEETDEPNPFSAVALKATNIIRLYFNAIGLSEKGCERIMKMPFIHDLLKSPKNRFDVIFLEQFFMFECFLPITEKLEAPVIGTFSGLFFPGVDFYHGNPCNPSVFPVVVSDLGLEMTFFQRLKNVYYYLVDMYFREIVVKAQLRKFYDKYFPSFDLEKSRKISLTFLHTSSKLIPRPMVPTIVDVAGIHLEMATKQQIPENIQKFIDEAPHGVILFSLGSIVSGPALTTEMRTAFKEAFSQISQRVIWKFDEQILGLSDNVMMSKWVPQNDILAHPNVVAFMSHCGALSTLEAIYNGKPMMLIPIFADQPSVAARLAELNVGALLDITSFTKDDLVELIQEIVNNPKYTKNMRKLSNTMTDLPTSPSKSIVFWTEYVLRHNGAEHLRTEAADMPFYRYLLLDVIAFVIIVFIVSVSVLVCLCKTIYRTVISTKKGGKIGVNKKAQ